MFRKVILPIILIIVSTVFSIFFSYKFENHNAFMFVVIETALYAFGFYSITKHIIDKFELRNKSFSKKEKIIEALIFSSVLIGALTGYYITTFWTKRYHDAQLSKYGIAAKGVIVSSKRIGKRGTVFVYEYFDQKSVKYQNTIDEDYLQIGDTLYVYYSS